MMNKNKVLNKLPLMILWINKINKINKINRRKNRKKMIRRNRIIIVINSLLRMILIYSAYRDFNMLEYDYLFYILFIKNESRI